MITTGDAVSSLRAGAEWLMEGDDIENIQYITANVVPVTRAEVEAEIKKLEADAANKAAVDAAATSAAIAHAKSLGFTDAMIGVMYPNLVTGAEPLVVGRESLNIPAKIDNNVTLDTVTP